MKRLLLSLTVAAAALAASPSAHAQRVVSADDRVYVVRPGDSVRRIAGTLQVSLRDLLERNHIAPPYTLRIGRRLRLPEGVPQEVLRTLPSRDETAPAAAATDGAAPHHTGVVTMVRVRDSAEVVTNFNNTANTVRLRVERWFRARSGAEHVIHPRMRQLLPMLSDRFAGRRILIVSGYRPHRGGRDALRNHHAMGSAVDLRVEGIGAQQVWDFCRTLPRVGCGYYPRANYVHIDIRPEAASWTVRERTGSRGDNNVPPEDDIAEVLAEGAAVEGAAEN